MIAIGQPSPTGEMSRGRRQLADISRSIPRRVMPAPALAAPAPTWERDVDVVVLGSGAAGLAAALAVRPVRSVLIVTKDVLNAGSTAWAQGGLAGVLDPTDSLEEHVRDTLAAGAGLCDEAVVRELVAEAPTAIRYLMRLGAAFDPGDDGARSGAHPRGRPQPQPHRPRRRRPHRRRGPAHARRVGAGGRRRGARAGLRPRPRHRHGADDGSRQAAGVTVALLDPAGDVESVGIGDRPRRRARHRRLRPDLRVDVEPARGHGRRRRRSPCAPGSPCATSSSCSSTRR